MISKGDALKVLVLISSGLLYKQLISIHSYSGEKLAPKFGDYEAQRHWMEVTVHTPIANWYVGSPGNELEYWGIDYPPLSAYQSWLYGKIISYLHPQMLALSQSRGYESEFSKFLLRQSVLYSDLLFMILPSMLFAYYMVNNHMMKPRKNKEQYYVGEQFQNNCGQQHDASGLQHDASGLQHGASGQQQDASGQQHGVSGQQQDASGQQQDASGQQQETIGGKMAINRGDVRCEGEAQQKQAQEREHNTTECMIYQVVFVVFVVTFQVGQNLIDHGHFQYNCISLGFTVMSIYSIFTHRELLGSFFYVLAITHKHMALYYSLAFFSYLLGKTLKDIKLKVLGKVMRVCSLGLVVLGTLFLVFLPFMKSRDSLFKVLERLAPLNRGLYEDYVANFWCTTSVIFKWRKLYSHQLLAKLCMGMTLFSILPANILLVMYPSKMSFLYGLAISAFGFYFFAYQVHEKSILLPLLPINLLSIKEPILNIYLPIIASFSMYPLLIKDKLIIAYIATNVIYFCCADLLCDFLGFYDAKHSLHTLEEQETLQQEQVNKNNNKQYDRKQGIEKQVDPSQEPKSRIQQNNTSQSVNKTERQSQVNKIQLYIKNIGVACQDSYNKVNQIISLPKGQSKVCQFFILGGLAIHVLKALLTTSSRYPYLFDLLIISWSFLFFGIVFLYLYWRIIGLTIINRSYKKLKTV